MQPIDILIVDDDRNMRLTLIEILSQDGYSIMTASSGEEAIELCRVHAFRLVLLDVRMPGIDGIETLRRILERSHRAPIALMSAYANTTIEDAARANGALAFLRKPLDIETVMKLTSAVMNTAVLWVGRVMDDEKAVQNALAEHGFRATVIESLSEAERLADEDNYDAIIVDIEHAGATDDALSEFARHEHGAPIILIDSADRDGEIRRRRELAACKRVERPFTDDELFEPLDQIRRERFCTVK